MMQHLILTAEQMRRCDRYTMDTVGIPSRVLMERAAKAAVTYLLTNDRAFPRRQGVTLILCGGGNNGGDGLAMARFLSDGSWGDVRRVAVCFAGRLKTDGTPDTDRMSEECRRQFALAVAAGVTFITPDDVQAMEAHDIDVAVDALFGIGLDRPITGVAADLLRTVRSWGCPVLAIDIPSGVDADSGAILGEAYAPATATVTMQALKRGLVLFPGASLCGDIQVCDIGISLVPVAEEQEKMFLCDDEFLRRVMPPRTRRSNKGSYGRVALLVGSEGMAGAAVLAASASLHTGAGLIDVCTPEANRVILQARLPEAMVQVADGQTPRHLAEHIATTASTAVVGCGLGTSDEALARLTAWLDIWPADGMHTAVLDADALNLLSSHENLWQTSALSARDGRIVITPHPGEMARLCGCTTAEVTADILGTAVCFAQKHGVVVVLKDAHTVIAAPDGTCLLCTAGHAGMATGGAGDVLAGIIGSLLSQARGRIGESLTVAEVAAAGVYLHALAGEAAASHLGEYACTAGDLVEHIAAVTKDFSDSRTKVGFASYR